MGLESNVQASRDISGSITAIRRICIFSGDESLTPVLAIDCVAGVEPFSSSISIAQDRKTLNVKIALPPLLWNFKKFDPGSHALWRIDWTITSSCWSEDGTPIFAKTETKTLQNNPYDENKGNNTAVGRKLSDFVASKSKNRKWSDCLYFPAENGQGNQSLKTWYNAFAVTKCFGLSLWETAQNWTVVGNQRDWAAGRKAWSGDVALEFVPQKITVDRKNADGDKEKKTKDVFRLKISRLLTATRNNSTYRLSLGGDSGPDCVPKVWMDPPYFDDWNASFITCCQADEAIGNARWFPIPREGRFAPTPWIVAIELSDGDNDAGKIVGGICRKIADNLPSAIASIDGADDPSFVVVPSLSAAVGNRYCAIAGFWLHDPHGLPNDQNASDRIRPANDGRCLLRFGSFRAITGTEEIYEGEGQQNLGGVVLTLPQVETLDKKGGLSFVARQVVSAWIGENGNSLTSINCSQFEPLELAFADLRPRAGTARKFRFDALDLNLDEIEAGNLRFAIEPRGANAFGYIVAGETIAQTSEKTPWVLRLQGGSPNGSVRAVERDSSIFSAPDLASSQLVWIEAGTSLIPKGSLEVIERATEFRGRVMQARLKASPEAAASIGAAKAVVGIIRSEPFFVGRIEMAPLIPSDTRVEIATWQNLTGAPSGWKFRAPDGEVDIVFPPQGIGEATLKASGGPEISDGKIAQARLTPPTKLTGRPAYFESNFVEAPWDPLTVFGFAGQRAPGALVKRIDAEFTYGLAAQIQPSGVRAAEIGATKGAPPIALTGDRPPWGTPVFVEKTHDPAIDKQRRKAINKILDEAKDAFKEFRDNWSARLAGHRSRVASIELWRGRAGETLHFDKSEVGYKLRGKADVRRPVPLPPAGGQRGKFSQDYRNVDPNSKREATTRKEQKVGSEQLPGGAEWGFESTLIYEKVLLNPEAVAGEIAGIRLSARGGSAWQKAEFDNGLTKIYATVVDGRTNVYTVERVGRIAGLWNRAKHVLQYERSAAETDQMLSNKYPDKHKGRAALRKVAEYVELLEPIRSYPDIGGTEAGLGPLRATDFKSRIIPVNGAWGGDFGTIGWRVPLWKRGEPGIYADKPQINVRLACDPALGEDVTGQVSNPERLYFYSSIRTNTPLTDRWAAEAGIDFPTAQSPVPPQWSEPYCREMEFDPIPPGLEDFTLLVELPKGVQVDLNAGRPGKPLGARLRSVSFARGRPRARADVVKAIEQLPEASRGLATLAAGRPIEGWVERLTKAGADFDRTKIKISVEIESVKNLIAAQTEKENLCTKLKSEFVVSRDRVLGQILSDAAKKLDELDTFTDSAVAFKVEATRALESAIAKIFAEIRRFDFGRTELRKAFDAVEALERGARGAIDAQAMTLGGIIDEFTSQNRLPGDLAKICARAKGETVRMANALRGSLNALRDPLSFVAGILPTGNAVKGVIVDCVGAIGRCQTQIDVFQGTLTGQIDALSTASEATWTTLRDDADAAVVQAKGELLGRTAKIAISIRQPLIVLDDAIKSIVGDRNKLLEELQETSEKLIQALQDTATKTQVDAVLVQVRTETAAGLDALATEAKRVTDEVFAEAGPLCTYLSLGNDAKQILEDLQGRIAALTDAKSAMALATDRALRELERSAARLGASLLDRLSPNALDKILYDVDGYLRVVRALGDPPSLPNLEFKLPELGDLGKPARDAATALAYYIDEAKDWIAMTPSFGVVTDLGNNLSNLGLHFPSIGLRDRLLPPVEIGSFEVPDLFRNLGGLDIGSGLFKFMKLPDGIGDNVKVSHGFDKETKTGWLEADVNVKYDSPIVVFDFSPVRVSIHNASFVARARAEADVEGRGGIKERWGRISGDWVLEAGGQPAVTFRRSALSCDDSGRIAFDTSTDRIETAPALLFLQRMTEQFKKKAEDAGFGVIESGGQPIGIRKGVDVPLPPMTQGAWGVSGLHFSASMALFWKDPDNSNTDVFALAAALNIGSPQSPFTITVFVLGGCGWVKIESRYTPTNGKIDTTVDVALGASAAVGFNAGGFVGFVQLYVAINVRYTTKEGGGVAISFVFGMNGTLTVIGLITIDVCAVLTASFTPDNKVVGHGTLSAEIRISRFFSKSVSTRFTRTLS
jgi:hypothetical protein